MNYYSTNNKFEKACFKQAVINGLASDGGLYMPEIIPVLSDAILNRKRIDIHEIGYEISKQFIGDEINSNRLQDIISESLNFIIPVLPLSENIFALELFHGPTLAFKDVGARFMARVLSYFHENEKKEITILTATSGDTGSAVANGFYNVEGINVVILYPSKGVSELQEKQMTTLGKNIQAIEINGTFDDCQRLVKQAFGDTELKKKLQFTSANSINIARLIPQSFYYLQAYSMVKEKEAVLFSVPSGNFGNITAGLLAKKMGINACFIAATNANKVVPDFLESGKFISKPSIKTISNAMDVGNPSNFMRILSLYNNSLEKIQKDIEGFSLSDDETKNTMKKVYSEKKYMLDPHSAIAYSALERKNKSGVFLATAHPAKFKDVVEETLQTKISLPDQLKQVAKKEKSAVFMPADFKSFKDYLLK